MLLPENPMDPLSITTGVLSLLAVCITVSAELKKLKQGSTDAGTTINALLVDVNGLRNVLQLMESTFDGIEVRDRFETAGQIGAYWQNLQESLLDGYDTLAELDTLAKALNRSVSVLSGPRRYVRLQAATSQIASHGKLIQVYRDAMQLSLQTIIFWNSVATRNDTSKITHSNTAPDQDIDRLVTNLKTGLQSLLNAFRRPDQQYQKETMQRLSSLMQSAATIYSSTSTAIEDVQKRLQLAIRSEAAPPLKLISSRYNHDGEDSANNETVFYSAPSSPRPVTSSLSNYPQDFSSTSLTGNTSNAMPLEKTNTKNIDKAFVRRKLVFVGDGACGKTCFVTCVSKWVFPQVYVPTVFENYECDYIPNNAPMKLALWDTAGFENYDRLRSIAYPDSHVVVICFAIDAPDSLRNVTTKWNPEILHFLPSQPIVLLGCKKDLRDDPATIRELMKTRQHPVTYDEACTAAESIAACTYIECSSKTGDGLREAFDVAARVALQSEIASK